MAPGIERLQNVRESQVPHGRALVSLQARPKLSGLVTVPQAKKAAMKVDLGAAKAETCALTDRGHLHPFI